MEENVKPKNIFEIASGRRPRKTEEKLDHTVEKVVTQESNNEIFKQNSSDSISNLNVKEMFARMQDMKSELEEKMNQVIDLSGVSKETVMSFIEDPQNFPPFEWEKVQAKKEELAKLAMNVVGVQVNKRKIQRKEEAETKKLRYKSLGGRKRWIPMQ